MVLKAGVIHSYLGKFEATNDRESFQYTEIECANQELDALAKAMDEVKDVQRVDFSQNGLAEISPMRELANIVHLNLSNNRIKNMTVFSQEDAFLNLKWLDISFNKFGEFPAFKCPKLEHLNVSGNKLEKVNEGWTGHESLRVLIAADNKFKSLAPFKAMPKLEELYLNQNLLTALAGWESLPALKKLHLRRNKIEKIDEELPPLDELTYINLRHNNIKDMETAFRIFQFPKVTDVNLINNPVERDASSIEVLMADFIIKNPKLQRFCKRQVNELMQLHAVYQA